MGGSWQTKCQKLSSAKSPRYETWGSVPWWDRTAAALCPKQGLYFFKHIHGHENDKTTFYSFSEEWILPVASTKEPEEKEFVVDSGACMHMVSTKDIHSVELETVSISKYPTTVMTANGEVQFTEEVTVISKNWTCSSKLFFRKKLQQFFFFEKLCGDHGFLCHWIIDKKPHLNKND